MNHIVISIIYTVFFVVILASSSVAGEIADYTILKIAASDSRAVMKTPSGELKVVNVGDLLTDEARVIEITEGRVVLEKQLEGDLETIIIRFDGKHQRIERTRTQGEPLKLYKPVTTVKE